MVLPDCVSRHHYLPAGLVIDPGREFRSRQLKVFATKYAIPIFPFPA